MSRARMRFCWNCGAEMGLIEDKHYDSRDTCGALECQRAEQDAAAQERAEAYERLDRDLGY